jgi:arylsulfatase A-like enzyme/Tfp pilus assembly protein PilF
LWSGHACARRKVSAVVLITVDGLRADRVGAYGYAAAATPAMDRMAAEGMRFENAVTASPNSLPANASVLTGLYPARHGARHDGIFTLPPEAVTLAEALQREGFETAAFVSAATLNRRFGLEQGFQEYHDDFSKLPPPFTRARRPSVQTWNELQEWFRRRHEAGSRKPFFLWCHFFDTREVPLPHPEQLAKVQQARPDAGTERQEQVIYDAAVSSVDEAVGRLLKLSEVEEWGKDVLVVLAGTHGHALGGHGEPAHGLLLSESTARVPLIFWGKAVSGNAGYAEKIRVSLVDVPPTILEMTGAEDEFEADGRSLAASVREGSSPEEKILFAESFFPRYEHGWSPAFAAWKGSLKWVFPEKSCYDLASGPEENAPLPAPPSQAEELSRALEQYVSSSGPASPAPPAGDLRLPLLVLNVEAVQAAGKAKWPERAFEARKGLPLLRLLDEARRSAEGGDFARALKAYDEALSHDPLHFHALMSKAALLAGMGRTSESLAVMKQIREAGFETAPQFALEARVFASERKTAQADELFERTLALDGDDPMLQMAYAGYLHGQGLDHEAAHAWEKALQLDPLNADAMAGMGALLMDQEQFEAAAAYLVKAVEMTPTPKILDDAAIACVMVGRTEDALHYWKHSLELMPERAATHFNIGRLYFRLGKHHLAKTHLESFLKLQGPGEEFAVQEARGLLKEISRAPKPEA